MRGAESNTELIGLGFVAGIVLTVMGSCSVGAYSDSSDDDPMAGTKDACVDAWELRNAGQELDEEQATVLASGYCTVYLPTVTTVTTPTTEEQG